METSAGRPFRRTSRLAMDYKGVSCFVTICSREARCTFSRILDGEVDLKPIGRIVDEEWRNTSVIRPDVLLDRYVVMPNHLHLIVYVPGSGTNRAANRELHRIPRSLGSIVAQFKATVTRRVRSLLNDPHYEVWQRGFFDRVIRSERELERTRTYILDNPKQWAVDPLYPWSP